MHKQTLAPWQHSHVFHQDRHSRSESALAWVIVLTATMMVAEIAAGLVFGSMALLADGLHMASHVVALGIAALAYRYARRLAGDRRLSFGSGKVNALGGFTGALLLALFAVMMAIESVGRLGTTPAIRFDEALAVAAVGLIVNLVCAVLLAHGDGHGHSHAHGHDGGDIHLHADGHRGSEDHTLRAAYLHVLADALTSALAIIALLGGKYFSALWLDPLMGLAGALLVARWCKQLLIRSAGVLLDRQGAAATADLVRAIEADGDARVADVHVWAIGPGISAAAVTVVAANPLPPEAYRARLPATSGIVHATIEIHRCRGTSPQPPWRAENAQEEPQLMPSSSTVHGGREASLK